MSDAALFGSKRVISIWEARLTREPRMASKLFQSLAGCENNFRKTLAQLPVMINVGKTQIFKGQVQQALPGLCNAKVP